ncbi:MAG: hypothetical protein QOC76_4998 [Mycobacterium sp.]|nr:hypothetical protein [Mycobacterium sp.]
MHQPEGRHGSHCAIRWLAHFARPGVRAAEGPSERNNAEQRSGGHQRIAQRVARKGRQQKWLAAETGRRNGKGKREGRDEHRASPTGSISVVTAPN